MTKILSWDVGIKNLAYCIIEKNNNEFKILEWDVINLLDDSQLCQSKLKGGKNCSNIAKYQMSHCEEKIYNDFDNGICVCEKHKLKPTLLDYIFEEKKTKNKEKQLYCNLCDNKATCKISNIENIFCWCDDHKKKGIMFEKKVKVKKMDVVTCKKIEPQVLAEKLFAKLDSITSFMHVDIVIIEDQPTFISRTMSAVAGMKRVASMIHSYFILRGIRDKQNNSIIKNVEFVSPSNKLRVNQKDTRTILKKTEKTKIYKMTKQLGIKYCEAFLDEEWSRKFSNFKKKDDPADAFLAGLKYLFGEELPEEYVKKLQAIGLEEITKKTKTKKEISDTSENNDDSESNEKNSINKTKKSKSKKI
jgi:hypothetical protein